MTWTRGAAALLVLGAAAAAGLRLWQGPQVPTDSVLRRDFVQSVVATGRVETPHRVDLAAQITGTVARLSVEEGQPVRAGQVLLEIDAAEQRAAAEQAVVAVRQAEARLRQLREVQGPVADAAIAQADAQLASARAQQARQRELFAQGFIGRAALDESDRAFAVAEAQARAARLQAEGLRPGGAESALADAQLGQARAAAAVAQAKLAYTLVRAPADGVVIARHAEPGDVAQPGRALLTLAPAGRTELVVQIDEKNLHLLAVGQQALASADAFAQQRFAATVARISPGVDAQRGSVEVTLAVPQPPAVLRPDMTVSVDIEVARRPQAVLVPLTAVRDADRGTPWALKLADGRAVRQDLRLGLAGGGMAEVLEGLAPGDRVVPLGTVALAPGDRARAATSP
jgi:HlyD family secretion protein